MKLVKAFLSQFFLKSNYFNLLLIFTFGLAYYSLIFNKYYQFEYFYVDNAYFASAIHALSHGEIPIVWHQWWGELNIFADHFHPILFLVAAFVKFFPSSFTIFLTIPVSITLTSIYALAICQKYKFPPLISGALLIAYFTSLPLQNAVLNGFHENVFVGVFLLASFWALISQKPKTFFVSLMMLLSTKETSFVLALWLLTYAYFHKLIEKKYIFILGSICMLWFQSSIKIIIPFLSGGNYRYGEFPHFPTLYQHLLYFFTPLKKWHTVLVSTGGFLFLPLFDLLSLGLVFYEFFTRFYFSISGNIQDTLYYHYGYQTVPILLLTSILAYQKLRNNFSKKYQMYLFFLLILSINFVFNWWALPQRGPLYNTIIPAFYTTTKNNAFLQELVNNTPPTTLPINTQNHLATALSSKSNRVRFLTHELDGNPRCIYKNQNQAKYLVYDLRPSQNANNYFNSTEEKSKIMLESLLKHQVYRYFYQKDNLKILIKNEPPTTEAL